MPQKTDASNIWQWLNQNSGALQSIAALSAVVLTVFTIAVLWVTWNAIKRGALASESQAEAARALTLLAKEQTEVARQQTEAIAKQSEAALRSAAATDAANRISEEANRLSVEQMQADLRPILIRGSTFDQGTNMTRDAIKNVGRGPAKDVQISIGTAKDKLPKSYIASRTVIGSGDEVIVSINHQMFVEMGMTVHYASLDGRRFVTSIYMREHAIKHDFEELKS
jgi:hypothetical protein